MLIGLPSPFHAANAIRVIVEERTGSNRGFDTFMSTETLSALSAEQLAALLAARLCHDLVSPIAALGAALSVLDDDDSTDMHDDAMGLVKESAKQAQAKLEFSRLAFGAGGSAPGILDTRELQRLTEGMFATVKPDIVWKVESPGLEKAAARLLLNMAVLGVEAAPRGGTVTVEGVDAAGGARLQVVSEGRRAKLEDSVVKALAGDEPEDGFDGRSVQPYYAGVIARGAAGRITARIEGERVEFVALVAPPEER